MSYRIKTIEQMTGLSRNTITAWERRYGLIAPQKDASGYRAYADADVEMLLRVRTLLDQGLQIGEIVGRIRAERASGRAVFTQTFEGIPEIRAALLEHLAKFDRLAAEAVVHRMLELSFRRRLDDVYIPVLHAIGDGWANGTYSVAQEHFATSFIREQMVSIMKSLEVGPRDGPLTVCAGYPGEQHELGLLAVAIHLALRAHRIVYLGANLPLDELIAVVRQTPPALVCVSTMTEPDSEGIYANALRLRRETPAGTLVAFGGPAVAPIADRTSDDLVFCTRFDALLTVLEDLRGVRAVDEGVRAEG